MIVLVTDFGPGGPYVGQMRAVLAREAPGATVIELFSDAPAHDPRATAYLLAAYAPDFPPEAVFLCVVDPGVGTQERLPVIARAGGKWFVGPGNGLFDVVLKRAADRRLWEIRWAPPRLSASFHGRDLFAPVAAMIARGQMPPRAPLPLPALADCAEDLDAVVYVDVFGNVMIGRRASTVAPYARLEAGGRLLARRRTFGDVAPGTAFWYENANGLAEIAVNRGRADRQLGLKVGDAVRFRTD